MKLKTAIKLVILLTAMCSFFSKAELRMNGYASIIAGKTLSGNEVFLADAVSGASYDNDLSFSPESLLALQLNGDFADLGNIGDITKNLTFTIQAIAKAADDYDPEIEHAYLTYQLTPHWKVKVGRLPSRLYLYSDYLEVGYAYDFMRPPSAVYYSPLSHYEGVNLTLNDMVGNYAYEIQFLAGEASADATYTSEVLGVPVKIETKDVFGTNGAIYGEDWEAKFAYLRVDDANLSIAGVDTFSKGVEGEYISGAYSKQWNNWLVNLEASLYSDEAMFNDLTNYFASVGYRKGKWLPTLGYAMYDEDSTSIPEGPTLRGPQIDYSITSFTLRYDFHSQAAFKFDYSQYRDKGEAPYIGDSDVIAFGIDLTF